MGTSTTRRDFLKTAGFAAASAPFVSAASYDRISQANERLRVGIIGCGGMAGAHLDALIDMVDVDVVSVCDAFETRARAFQDRIWRQGGRAERYGSHEALLDAGNLDYVLVATPEHWHSRQTLDALDAGLHVYCEKPMTHRLDEAFEVVEKARESGRFVQVGVQGMSDDSYASAHRAILDGKLGPVVEAQIDYVRRYPLASGPWRSGVDPNLPKPDDLDWQTWLGPAPDHAWSPPRYFEWRNYSDYSGGICSDLFIHRLTRILKACGLTIPTRAVGMGGIYVWDDGRDLPDNFEMLLEYPAVPDVTPGMTVHVLGTMANNRGNDHVIRGHEASLVFTRSGWDIVSQDTGEVVESHVKTGAEDVTLHHRNLHGAMRNGETLVCPPELGLYGVAAIVGALESWFRKAMMNWDEQARNWT